MASSGPLYSTTWSSVASSPYDSNAWLNVANLSSAAGLATITAATYDSPDTCELAVGTAFGFNIPAGATINGVTVEINGRYDAGTASIAYVALHNAGSVIGTAKTTDPAITASLATYTFGSTSDAWGVSPLTPAIINSATFGVRFSVQADSANTDISFDWARITVEYTYTVQTLEAGFTTVAVSKVEVAGTASHIVLEGGFTAEAFSKVEVTGSVSEYAGVTLEAGFTSEAVSKVELGSYTDTTIHLNSTTTSGTVQSHHATNYLNMLDGTGNLQGTYNDQNGGMELFSGEYYGQQGFTEYNTGASIPDAAEVIDVVLKLTTISIGTPHSQEPWLELYQETEWDGSALQYSNWHSRTEMQNLGSLLARWQLTASAANSTQYTFTSFEAFKAAINKTGVSRFVLITDRMRLGTGPPTDSESVPFGTANNTGYEPDLEITYREGNVGAVVTHAVWECGFTSEVKSAVTVTGSVTEGSGTTYEAGFTSEAVSKVEIGSSGTATYYCADAADGYCTTVNGEWETANSYVNNDQDAYRFGASDAFPGGNWGQPFTSFDLTSPSSGDAIPVGAMVTGAELELHSAPLDSAITTSRYLRVYKYDWGTAVEQADFRNSAAIATLYSGGLGVFAEAYVTPSWAQGYNVLTDGPAMASGIAASAGGVLRLVVSDENIINHVTPTGADYLWLHSSHHATPSYRPRLTVEWSTLVVQHAVWECGFTSEARSSVDVTGSGGESGTTWEAGFTSEAKSAVQVGTLVTVHLNSTANCAAIVYSLGTYAQALAGTSTLMGVYNDNSAGVGANQYFTDQNTAYMGFLEIDTSGIPDGSPVTAVVPKLRMGGWVETSGTAPKFLLLAGYAFADPVTSADWRNTAALQALTVVAEFQSSGSEATYTWCEWTSTAAMLSAINKTGHSHFVMVTEHERMGYPAYGPPTDGEASSWTTYNQGADYYPDFEVTYLDGIVVTEAAPQTLEAGFTSEVFSAVAITGSVSEGGSTTWEAGFTTEAVSAIQIGTATTIHLNSTANCGAIVYNGGTIAQNRAGTSNFNGPFNDNSAGMGSDGGCYMGWMEFDTSSIPDDASVTQVVPKLTTIRVTLSGLTDYPVFRWMGGYDHGAAVGSEDWQDTSELAALTIMATYQSSGSTTNNTQYAWTSTSRMLDYISKTGHTHFVMVTDHEADAGYTPTVSEECAWATANQSEAYWPDLEITYIQGVVRTPFSGVWEAGFTTEAVSKVEVSGTVTEGGGAQTWECGFTSEAKSSVVVAAVRDIAAGFTTESHSTVIIGSSFNVAAPVTTAKMIFLHHSTGEQWLADGHGGLALELEDNNYFVSDTNYGWGTNGIGDYTDLGHWYEWFRGTNSATYMAEVYGEYGQHYTSGWEYSRLSDPTGSNEIVMFKSCFPNSSALTSPSTPIPDIGDNPMRGQAVGGTYTVANAKGIYIDLLNYFGAHTDKLFVAIVMPPVASPDTPYAREFANWLVNNWLQDYYTHNNVVVFDYYNVLSSNTGTNNDAGLETGNHHRVWNNAIQHKTDDGVNHLEYPTVDDHPSAYGDAKATAEFVPLLNLAYNIWKGIPGAGAQVQHAAWECGFTAEAKSAVVVSGSVTEAGTTWECGFTSEAESAVVISGEKTDWIAEAGFTSEAKSSVEIAGGKAEATWECGFTTEAKSDVAITGTVTEGPGAQTWEAGFTSEAKSSVVLAAGAQIYGTGFTSEAKSAVTAAGEVAHATWECGFTSEAKSAVTVAGSVEHEEWECGFTSEVKSSVVVAGQKTDATWEAGFTSEALSKVEVIGTEAGATYTWECGFTSEAKSAVAVVGGPVTRSVGFTTEAVSAVLITGTAAHLMLEAGFTSEAKSAVVVSGTKAEAVWECGFTSEAKSDVVVSGSKTDVTWDAGFTSEAVSKVEIAGYTGEAVWECGFTAEARSAVVVSATKADATWECSFTSEAVSRVVITATVAHAVLEAGFTSEVYSNVTFTGQKNAVFIHELGFTSEALSRVTVTASRLPRPNIDWVVGAPEGGWSTSIISRDGGWSLGTPESAWSVRKPEK